MSEAGFLITGCYPPQERDSPLFARSCHNRLRLTVQDSSAPFCCPDRPNMWFNTPPDSASGFWWVLPGAKGVTHGFPLADG